MHSRLCKDGKPARRKSLQTALSAEKKTRLESTLARPRRFGINSTRDLVESDSDARATTRGGVKAGPSGGVGTVYDDARGSGASSRSLTSRLLTNLIWNRSPSSSRVSGPL